MGKSKTLTAAKELIRMYFSMSGDQIEEPDNELLESNNMSTGQWYSFVNLAVDLDLNEAGVSILLDEVRSGRVHLPSK